MKENDTVMVESTLFMAFKFYGRHIGVQKRTTCTRVSLVIYTFVKFSRRRRRRFPEKCMEN